MSETGKEERGKLSECTIHTALVFIPALLGKAAWPDFHNNIYFLWEYFSLTKKEANMYPL